MIFNRNRRYLDNLECLASLICLTVLISSGIFYFLSLAMTSSMIVIQLKVFFSNFKLKLLSCQIKKILIFAMKKKIFCGSNKSRTKEFNVMHNEYIFFLVFFSRFLDLQVSLSTLLSHCNSFYIHQQTFFERK